MEFRNTNLKTTYMKSDGDSVIPLSFFTLLLAILFAIVSFNGCTEVEKGTYELVSVSTFEKPNLIHTHDDGSKHYGDPTIYYKFHYQKKEGTKTYTYNVSIPENNNNGKYTIRKDESLPHKTIVLKKHKHSFFSPTGLFNSTIKDGGDVYIYND